MNATVAFYNEEKPDANAAPKRVVVVPEGTVQNGSVFVVVNNRARKKNVTTSGTSARGVLVENGLLGGENVIVSPPADLKDNQRVEVKP
jgi:HlyD family secretion protein